MIFNRDSLRNFFVCALIFSYHGFVNDAYAGISSAILADPTEISGVTSIDIQDQTKTRKFSTASSASTTVKLCPEGQYVAACGNYRIGFNWLKPAKVPDPGAISNVEQQPDIEPNTETVTVSIDIPYKETTNYYISDDIIDLYKQMRIFFGNTDREISISYLDDNDNTISLATAPYLSYRSDREAILNNLCHPSSVDITCMACPNDAKVPASVVQLDADNLTIQGSWELHTFADCYMQEFEDSTGSYFYVPDDEYVFNAVQLNNSAKCYYQNTTASAIDTLAGDEIGTFVLGLYKNQRNATDRIYIPTTDIVSY